MGRLQLTEEEAMQKNILQLSVFCIFLFLSPLTYAWNANGHIQIANIAYRELTPQAKATVDQLVAKLHEEYPEMNSFNNIAAWLDTVRGQKIETYTHWHYIDIAFSDDGTPLKELTDTDNGLWAEKKIEQVVKNAKANPYERARFLAFLVHIVGDLHQPLHTVSRISKTYPDGDRGGNLFYVLNKGNKVNLHKLWDDGLGEFTYDSRNEGRTEQETDRLLAAYPKEYFKGNDADLKAEAWIGESNRLSTSFVYTAHEMQAVDSAYLETGKDDAKARVVLAGYRLGNLLNQLLQ